MAGGVVDGQAVSQAVTNPAFLFANGPTTGIGSIYLASPTSGAIVIDVQNSMNVFLQGIGGTQSVPATAYGAIPANTIPSGVNHQNALIALANLFDDVLGHKHDGTQGGGGPLAAVSGISVSGSGTLQGLVILTGSSLVSLTQVGNVIQINGQIPTLPQVLSAGNGPATAGINMAGGAIVGMSYVDYVEASFPPGFPATGHVYVAASADDHMYLRTAASATHRIDTSIAAQGNSALFGDVVIVPGSGVQVIQSGQNITISATGATGGGGGGSAMAILTKTAGYTVLTSDFSGTRLLLECNSASAATFTLPAASAALGYEIYVINIGSAVATIATNGTDTFGSTTDTTWTLVPGGSPQASNVFVSNGGSRWDGF